MAFTELYNLLSTQAAITVKRHPLCELSTKSEGCKKLTSSISTQREVYPVGNQNQ